jgi:hypothetical protein
MVYTEENVFADCTKDCKGSIDHKKHKDIWLAFCKWVIDVFERGRGVSILNFITLAWIPDKVQEQTTVTKQNDKKLFRPVWRMTQPFENSFHLGCKHKSDRRTPEDEEIFCKVISHDVNESHTRA